MPGLSAARDGLVARGDDGLQPELPVERAEPHEGHDGGAVRVGDDSLGALPGGLRIHLGNDQGDLRDPCGRPRSCRSRPPRRRPRRDRTPSERLPPALKRAMSTPSERNRVRAPAPSPRGRGSAVFRPAEREEARRVSSPTGKSRRSRHFNISSPTAPVAPAIATWGEFDMVLLARWVLVDWAPESSPNRGKGGGGMVRTGRPFLARRVNRSLLEGRHSRLPRIWRGICSHPFGPRAPETKEPQQAR